METLDNIQDQQTVAKVLIALTKNRGKQKILVSSMEGYETGYTINGIGIMEGEKGILLSLSEQILPFGGISQDIPEGDKRRNITSQMSDFDGQQRTDFIISHYELENGAAVEAKKFGWLPSGGEMSFVYDHKDEVNALLEAVGGDPLSEDLYWTSQMFSNEYPWHMSMIDGKFAMYLGRENELAVRPVASLEGYTEIE